MSDQARSEIALSRAKVDVVEAPRAVRESLGKRFCCLFGKTVCVVNGPERTEPAEREWLIIAMRRHDECIRLHVGPGQGRRIAVYCTKRKPRRPGCANSSRLQYIGQERTSEPVRLAIVLESRLDRSRR